MKKVTHRKEGGRVDGWGVGGRSVLEQDNESDHTSPH